MPIDIFVFPLAQVSAQFGKEDIWNVKMAPPLGEANGTHVGLSIEFEPVVYRRAPQRRTRGYDGELSPFLLARNDTARVSVFAGEVVPDLTRTYQAGDELAAKQHV